MSEPEIQESRLSEPGDAEVAQYQAISGLAVGGLIVALVAPVALAHPLLWVVPLAGVLLCLLALRQIASNAPALIGRKAAVVGLIVSVLCGVAAPSEWLAYGRLIDAEGRQFALDSWFEFLRKNEPHKAYQLAKPPEARLPLDERLWDHYSTGSELQREELLNYVRQPEIQSLLALGDHTRVRYYDTESRYRAQGDGVVEQVYAVTYQEAGQRKSFFVRLTLKRHHVASTGRAYWQVDNHEAGIRPRAMGPGEDGREG